MVHVFPLSFLSSSLSLHMSRMMKVDFFKLEPFQPFSNRFPDKSDFLINAFCRSDIPTRLFRYSYNTRLFRYSYKTIQIFLQDLSDIPTRLLRYSYKTIQIFLQDYSDIPTRLFRYCYKTIQIFLQDYSDIPTRLFRFCKLFSVI